MSIDTKVGGPGSRISLAIIAATLAPFWKDLREEQLSAIQEYLFVLLKWNQSINLTAIEDPMEVLARHFGESLFGASVLKIGKSRLADVGTGAGFPGLPMKIASPEMELVLFEPSLKKCAFLTEISQRLKLSGVTIRRERYEEFRPQTRSDSFDFVCARALGNYPMFLPWARRVLNPSGRVVLWLGTDESIRLGRRREFLWDAPIAIPESRRRVILIGRSASGG